MGDGGQHPASWPSALSRELAPPQTQASLLISPSISSLCRDRARNTGVISCTVCLEEFQTPITCILGKLGFTQGVRVGWSGLPCPAWAAQDLGPCCVSCAGLWPPRGMGATCLLKWGDIVQGRGLADGSVSSRGVYGKGTCRMPGVALDFSRSDLSEPVDVYSDWIDACEATNQ